MYSSDHNTNLYAAELTADGPDQVLNLLMLMLGRPVVGRHNPLEPSPVAPGPVKQKSGLLQAPSLGLRNWTTVPHQFYGAWNTPDERPWNEIDVPIFRPGSWPFHNGTEPWWDTLEAKAPKGQSDALSTACQAPHASHLPFLVSGSGPWCCEARGETEVHLGHPTGSN